MMLKKLKVIPLMEKWELSEINDDVIAGSFRDPSGRMVKREGILLREVAPHYQPHYDHFLQSGLYENLAGESLLIDHEELPVAASEKTRIYKRLKPRLIPFISYPYEWCFSQLKDAALLTLQIQERALQKGMVLKDASAYNVQFHQGRPILIDTLSFEKHEEGRPWVAYRQFCQHFLAPLCLMSHCDVRFNQLFLAHIDGIPLDWASAMLPFRSWFSMSILSHVHLHAKTQKHYSDKPVKLDQKISMNAMLGMLENLRNGIQSLNLALSQTQWSEYYTDTNYTSDGLEHKKKMVSQFIHLAAPQVLWDLGANTGLFSRIASAQNICTIAFDYDPLAVEKNYRLQKEQAEPNLLPLVMNLVNPSPAIGWAHEERMSLLERGPADCVMALAVIHHLVISNHVPLSRLAEFFAACGKWLIIEFVPKTDSQVSRILRTREDTVHPYELEIFEAEFSRKFVIQHKVQVKDSQRFLFLMKQKE